MCFSEPNVLETAPDDVTSDACDCRDCWRQHYLRVRRQRNAAFSCLAKIHRIINNTDLDMPSLFSLVKLYSGPHVATVMQEIGHTPVFDEPGVYMADLTRILRAHIINEQ